MLRAVMVDQRRKAQAADHHRDGLIALGILFPKLFRGGDNRAGIDVTAVGGAEQQIRRRPGERHHDEYRHQNRQAFEGPPVNFDREKRHDHDPAQRRNRTEPLQYYVRPGQRQQQIDHPRQQRDHPGKVQRLAVSTSITAIFPKTRNQRQYQRARLDHQREQHHRQHHERHQSARFLIQPAADMPEADEVMVDQPFEVRGDHRQKHQYRQIRPWRSQPAAIFLPRQHDDHEPRHDQPERILVEDAESADHSESRPLPPPVLPQSPDQQIRRHRRKSDLDEVGAELHLLMRHVVEKVQQQRRRCRPAAVEELPRRQESEEYPDPEAQLRRQIQSPVAVPRHPREEIAEPPRKRRMFAVPQLELFAPDDRLVDVDPEDPLQQRMLKRPRDHRNYDRHHQHEFRTIEDRPVSYRLRIHTLLRFISATPRNTIRLRRP